MKPILKLCVNLPEREVAEGEEIISENKRGKSMFVLKEGVVEITKKDVQINVISSPGSIFGEVSILLDRDHSATVRTQARSVFYVIDDAAEFLRQNPEINHHIAQLLAKRLNLVTNYLVDLKQQFESHSDHLGIVDEVLEGILHHDDR